MPMTRARAHSALVQSRSTHPQPESREMASFGEGSSKYPSPLHPEFAEDEVEIVKPANPAPKKKLSPNGSIIKANDKDSKDEDEGAAAENKSDMEFLKSPSPADISGQIEPNGSSQHETRGGRKRAAESDLQSACTEQQKRGNEEEDESDLTDESDSESIKPQKGFLLNVEEEMVKIFRREEKKVEAQFRNQIKKEIQADYNQKLAKMRKDMSKTNQEKTTSLKRQHADRKQKLEQSEKKLTGLVKEKQQLTERYNKGAQILKKALEEEKREREQQVATLNETLETMVLITIETRAKLRDAADSLRVSWKLTKQSQHETRQARKDAVHEMEKFEKEYRTSQDLARQQIADHRLITLLRQSCDRRDDEMRRFKKEVDDFKKSLPLTPNTPEHKTSENNDVNDINEINEINAEGNVEDKA